MLATTSDCLRLWDVVADEGGWRMAQRSTLVTSKSEFAAPLTSFAWSAVDPSLVVSSSVDTTCTIWDIQAGSAITQLIAHDREVYDVSWSPTSRDIFASVGADGSVRMFDIRALEHSTILYEVTGTLAGSTALLRLSFNPADENQLAIVHADSPHVFLLDVRKPSVPIAELQAHKGTVNTFAWDDHAALATGSDDCQVLVWDLSANATAQRASGGSTANGGSRSSGSAARVVTQPSLAYTSPSEVNSVIFGGDWVAMATGNAVRCLQV
jgi:WD repeat-containing protein 68